MLGGEDFGIGSDLKAALREEADKRYRHLIPVLFDKLEEIIASALSKAVKGSDSAQEVASETKDTVVSPEEPPCIQESNASAGFATDGMTSWDHTEYERRERE